MTKDDPLLGTRGKVNPPLRDQSSVEKLWRGINEGVVDCIGSHHAPHSIEAKERDIWAALPGFPGIETLLPLILSEGVNKGRITLPKLVEVCSANAAKALGLHPRKGGIAIGADADLVIIDLKKKVKIRSEILHSAAAWTPYEGRELRGWPTLTMLRGNVIMEDGEPIARSSVGRYIPRQKGMQQQ